jgi:hypothetical protein
VVGKEGWGGGSDEGEKREGKRALQSEEEACKDASMRFKQNPFLLLLIPLLHLILLFSSSFFPFHHHFLFPSSLSPSLCPSPSPTVVSLHVLVQFYVHICTFIICTDNIRITSSNPHYLESLV